MCPAQELNNEVFTITAYRCEMFLIEQVVERNAVMADYRTAKVHVHHFVEYIARLIEILLKCMREIAIQRQTQQTLHQVRCIYNITVSGYFMYIADFVPSILQSKISVGRIEEVEFISVLLQGIKKILRICTIPGLIKPRINGDRI